MSHSGQGAAEAAWTSGHGISRSRALFWSLARSRLAMFGVALIAVLLVAAAFAPQLAPYDPEQGDLADRLRPPAFAEPDQGPTTFILGTDAMGRDVLSRIIFGTRTSLLVAGSAVLIGAGIGVSLGMTAGYYGGWVDDLLMRLADVQLAFPFILLAIIILVVMGPSVTNLIIVLSLGSWVTFARVTRGQVLSIKEREFVEAAHAMGASVPRIVAKAVLPNAVAAIIVVGSFTLAEMIVAEAALSFLGLGVPPDVPTWGGMLSEGRNYIFEAWWLGTFPGLAIMLTVLAINILGDWIRDYLDPRL